MDYIIKIWYCTLTVVQLCKRLFTMERYVLGVINVMEYDTVNYVTITWKIKTASNLMCETKMDQLQTIC